MSEQSNRARGRQSGIRAEAAEAETAGYVRPGRVGWLSLRRQDAEPRDGEEAVRPIARRFFGRTGCEGLREVVPVALELWVRVLGERIFLLTSLSLMRCDLSFDLERPWESSSFC